MKDLEWKDVLGQRVALVPSKPHQCGVDDVLCPFLHGDCSVGNDAACASKRGAQYMFITEDQLPAYLATRLMNQS